MRNIHIYDIQTFYPIWNGRLHRLLEFDFNFEFDDNIYVGIFITLKRSIQQL